MNEHDRTPAPPLAEADLQRIEQEFRSGETYSEDLPRFIASLRAAWAERDEAVNAAHWLSLERERLQLAMDAAISEMPDSFYRRDLQAALTPPDASAGASS